MHNVSIVGFEVSEEEIAAVERVLRSGNLRQGPLCAQFEEEFATYVGAKHAIVVSSGTAALHIAYLALVKPGDDVLVPSFTFFATASMVEAAGGVPVFCDVDESTFTISLEELAARITSRTAAIAPVHLFGNAVDVEGIQKLAGEHGLAVIWDAAQAHGTRYGDADVGSLPGVSCYSFYPTKNMTTGEGGMLTTDDADLAHRFRLLRDHGAEHKYFHTSIGYNYRLTDLQAAIGIGQLRNLPRWISARRRNAATLSRTVDAAPGLRAQVTQPGSVHAYHQFSVVVDPAVCSRDEIVAGLNALGIQTAIHYPMPLHRQPVFESKYPGISLSVSEMLSRNIFSLPVHHLMTEEDVEAVTGAIEQVTSESRSPSATVTS